MLQKLNVFIVISADNNIHISNILSKYASSALHELISGYRLTGSAFEGDTPDYKL